jgi:alpha-methylacyl-CoA racemase
MAALDGVRVLDLTRLLPGPLATLILTDLGATVDKLEDPHGGDYARVSGPSLSGASVLFHTLNRGKRSLVLDLKLPEGVAAFKRLVPRYDVVFEQFRPGVLERLGVGHQALLELNPRLVVCALTGYGQTGPLKDRAGHDLNYMARAGLLGMQGPQGGLPQCPGFQLADVSGGLWSVIAILAALRDRDQTGHGAILDVAMFDGLAPFAAPTIARLLGGETLERGMEMLTGGIAPYNVYETSDHEAVTLAALEPKFLQRFCEGNGLAWDMMMLVPGDHQLELRRKFSEVIASKTRAEWEAFNRTHDCCLEPVLRPEELRSDAHVKARGVFVDIETRDGAVGEFRTPVTPREPVRPAPRAGQHTEEILRDAGFDEAEIAGLEASRAVR